MKGLPFCFPLFKPKYLYYFKKIILYNQRISYLELQPVIDLL